MLKVIIDTNVIVSGFVFGGRVREILDLILAEKIEMQSCEELETESLRILVSKFGISFEKLIKAKELFETSKKYELKKPYPKISRDENDNFLLALIQASKANKLITGDKDLLVLGDYMDCEILDPADFLRGGVV